MRLSTRTIGPYSYEHTHKANTRATRGLKARRKKTKSIKERMQPLARSTHMVFRHAGRGDVFKVQEPARVKANKITMCETCG